MVLLCLWVRHLAYLVNGITLFTLEYGVRNDIVLFHASGSQPFSYLVPLGSSMLTLRTNKTYY